jgi:hypothetical protein
MPCKQQASLNDKFEIPLGSARLISLVNHCASRCVHKTKEIPGTFQHIVKICVL